MIFPPIRISDLERDLEAKEKAFEYSTRLFQDSLRDKLKPITFIKDHPKLITGFLFSILTSARFLKSISKMVMGRKTKNKIFWKIVKAGWFWKLFRIFGGKALKKMGPMFNTLGQSTLKKFLKSL